mmetsp:Transcript_4009/g.12716  ORF Transcript_4009/g.12716 Transcript_4009/m.12716 type:complete len:205 (-) Transcript_4009:317-931(-)
MWGNWDILRDCQADAKMIAQHFERFTHVAGGSPATVTRPQRRPRRVPGRHHRHGRLHVSVDRVMHHGSHEPRDGTEDVRAHDSFRIAHHGLQQIRWRGVCHAVHRPVVQGHRRPNAKLGHRVEHMDQGIQRVVQRPPTRLRMNHVARPPPAPAIALRRQVACCHHALVDERFAVSRAAAALLIQPRHPALTGSLGQGQRSCHRF